MSHKRKVLRGSASNVVRVLLSMLVSMVLPPFLVHRMPPVEYSAWVLILQLSAYVNLLDFGLQTAIGKFIAEYDAGGDRQASHRIASTSFTMLAAASVLACIGLGIMTWSVPALFHQMPTGLIGEVRLALIAVGLSTAVVLPFNTFLSLFTGLQQYLFPTVLATVSRVGSAVALIATLFLHGSLLQLALVMAAFNLATAAAQWFGWQRLLKARVGFSFFLFHRASAIQLAKYGSVLSVWTLAMLFVSGLDIVIVGHYRFTETGFYAIANSAASFMLLVVSSVFGPLVPAVSSMQAGATPEHLGDVCTRITRYCTLLLCLLGLPLVLGAYPLLNLWVGKRYAMQSALFLEMLVLGNAVRQLALPYILIVVATGKQHLATIAAICEAVVNLAVSLWLVQKVGAVGVAAGTFVGAFVSVGMHLTISMPRTQAAVSIQRTRFLVQGLIRPLLMLVPSFVLFPFWKKLSLLPAPPAILCVWVIATAGTAWTVCLTREDRAEARGLVARWL